MTTHCRSCRSMLNQVKDGNRQQRQKRKRQGIERGSSCHCHCHIENGKQACGFSYHPYRLASRLQVRTGG